MVDKLYNLTSKGFLKALSFPYFALLAFYGMAILWIHGVGFEIKTILWRLIFLPIIGYIIVLGSIIRILI